MSALSTAPSRCTTAHPGVSSFCYRSYRYFCSFILLAAAVELFFLPMLLLECTPVVQYILVDISNGLPSIWFFEAPINCILSACLIGALKCIIADQIGSKGFAMGRPINDVQRFQVSCVWSKLHLLYLTLVPPIALCNLVFKLFSVAALYIVTIFNQGPCWEDWHRLKLPNDMG